MAGAASPYAISGSRRLLRFLLIWGQGQVPNTPLIDSTTEATMNRSIAVGRHIVSRITIDVVLCTSSTTENACLWRIGHERSLLRNLHYGTHCLRITRR